ncbi:hypothetical protein QBC31_22315 [Streptomyces sp. B21-079]|uniref:hypothetical protein n=1 Tax=Streptomyces sp. B21-079 TaxID=3039409 RepID=UPI002FEFE7CC
MRAEDDQAVKEGKLAPDRERELAQIRTIFRDQPMPGWLTERVALGSAKERAQRRQREERHKKARIAVAHDREAFVTAAGKRLAEPLALHRKHGVE